jgi:type II secretory pathway component GspD/PulD (secretin)
MKTTTSLLTTLALLVSPVAHGQDEIGDLPEAPGIPAVPDLPPASTDLAGPPGPASPAGAPAEPGFPSELPGIPGAPGDALPEPATSGGEPPVEPVAPPEEDPVTGAEAGQPIQGTDEGYLIKDAALNDIFQFLAKQAGRQYFHNMKIATPEFRVTGHLNDGNPLQQMEELAFMYGLMLYTKGNTVYALTQAQLSQLPSTEFSYQLRYLRPQDKDQIMELIKPVLSPGTGIVNFEPKTNTIIIIDTAHRIDQARDLLHKIDQPKGQIIVETKILRVNSKAAERVGVNWSATLGENGTTIEIARSLNAMFGIAENFTDIPNSASGIESTIAPDANLVLSPVQLTGVLRALAEGGVATQVSNPTLITEDNEQGTISIIDRVPIITTTTNQGSGDVSSVSEEVRYKIDPGDPTINEDPEKHREIGISMVVTPTLLPDGTVRMRLRPRSAQITDQIRSPSTDNVYPRVTESMIESLSRVPDGYSLVVGGFYGETESNDKTKVPLLGDIPILNFFFKSKETVKEQASLVFIVTPTSYDPSSRSSTGRQSNRIHSTLQLTRDHDWVDTENPGPAHEPNLRRGIRGLRPQEAPYYPTQEQLNKAENGRVHTNTSTNSSSDRSERKRSFSRARRY